MQFAEFSFCLMNSIAEPVPTVAKQYSLFFLQKKDGLVANFYDF